MSDSSSDINYSDADQQTIAYAGETPAIGLVVTEDNEDAIARYCGPHSAAMKYK
jgi:hypothetical protein